MEPLGWLVAGAGTFLSAIGFWLASRRNLTSTYTSDLEKKLLLVEKERDDERERRKMAEYALDKSERRIEKLLDRLNGK